jgi:hypothetical protein
MQINRLAIASVNTAQKKVVNIGFLFIFLSCLSVSLPVSGQDDLDLGSKLEKVTEANIFSSPDYYTWGSSVVKGEDGKYYMFYSRWPHGKRKPDDDSLNYIFDGFAGWMKYSEIACAVSDKLEGPYAYISTVLASKGKEGRWDRFTKHNPHIKKFNGYYYLYYISSSYDSSFVPINGPQTKERLQWMRYNCGQSIGVIKAKTIKDLLSGNVTDPKDPIVRIDHQRTFEVATNPSVTEGPDGRYYMMYKSRLPGGHMTFWFAVADKPDSPFVTLSNVTSAADMASEDPYMWYDKKRKAFYAIAKYFTNSKKYGLQNGSLVLLYSKDGKEWAFSKYPEVSKRELVFANGKIETLAHLERPFIFFDKDGQALALFAAASYEQPSGGDPLTVPERKNTFNVCIPLQKE